MEVDLKDHQVSDQLDPTDSQQIGELDQALQMSGERMDSDAESSELSDVQSFLFGEDANDDFQLSASFQDLLSVDHYDSNSYSVQSKLPLEVWKMIFSPRCLTNFNSGSRNDCDLHRR